MASQVSRRVDELSQHTTIEEWQAQAGCPSGNWRLSKATFPKRASEASRYSKCGSRYSCGGNGAGSEAGSKYASRICSEAGSRYSDATTARSGRRLSNSSYPTVDPFSAANSRGVSESGVASRYARQAALE